MPDETPFAELMAQLRDGNPDAARAIFVRFGQRLLRLAQRNLDSRVRQKVDPEDVLQSAMKSFFLRQADGQFDLSDWDSLWSLLVTITLRKCGHQVEYFRAACRDVQREQALAALADSAPSWELLGAEPTPSQAAMLAETVEQIMSSLNDERERRMAVLYLQGCKLEEISTQVGRSERTVQRVLNRIRDRLERLRDEET
jgi:RNA polymerase sigma-70 factor (ECF subfamily)